jgi:hypothetical protein
VKDIWTHATLLEGRSEHGLYPLRFRGSSFTSTNKTFPTFTSLLGFRTTPDVWHSRLGHSSISTVNHVIKAHHLPLTSNKINKISFCDFCQLGKSKQLPFSHSSRISTKPLELIHIDIWTSPTPSMSGCKYYIIFIDDFSRFSWLYPLHYKSDAYDTFIKFKLLTENQLSSPIKQLQIDGGGEFNSTRFHTRFQTLLTQNGILHRKTCPHTSQQNGIAERKLRHVLETGLTLLAHSGLSNKFWVDAFLTSIYVINRLPTPVLNNSSPFEQIYHRNPDYSLLKVFGCKCFPLLRPYTSHKLDFRSKPCIFLGYSYKGYRCFDPLTQNVYLSRHVVFDEASFPAKETANSHLSATGTAAPDVPSLLSVSLSPPNFSPSITLPTVPHTSHSAIPAVTPTSPSPPIVNLAVPPPLLPSTTPPTSPSLPTPAPTTKPPSSPIPYPPIAPLSLAPLSPINSALALISCSLPL